MVTWRWKAVTAASLAAPDGCGFCPLALRGYGHQRQRARAGGVSDAFSWAEL